MKLAKNSIKGNTKVAQPLVSNSIKNNARGDIIIRTNADAITGGNRGKPQDIS
ncbi:MAG: hypothetical protein NOM71_01240 [Archaeoglobi archaeon]|nr:hypothetical protein [Archaeoglobi archaeon]